MNKRVITSAFAGIVLATAAFFVAPVRIDLVTSDTELGMLCSAIGSDASCAGLHRNSNSEYPGQIAWAFNKVIDKTPSEALSNLGLGWKEVPNQSDIARNGTASVAIGIGCSLVVAKLWRRKPQKVET